MTNPTPAQVAALAAVVRITPETHRHLFKVINIGGEDDEAEQWKPHNLPDPLGPDADGVWLAPMMTYLTKQKYGPCVDMSQTVVARACCGKAGLRIDEYADTATAALLQACLAARVPEVCAILEVTND